MATCPNWHLVCDYVLCSASVLIPYLLAWFNSLAPGRSQFDSKNGIYNFVLLIGIFRSHDNALRWMPQDLTDDKSTLIQVMAWCHQATSHFLNQCWPRSPKPYGVTRPQWVNTFPLRQNWCPFTDGILELIFLYDNCWILVSTQEKCLPEGPINNKPVLVQTIAWHWIGDRPMSEPIMVEVADQCMCNSASMSWFGVGWTEAKITHLSKFWLAH